MGTTSKEKSDFFRNSVVSYPIGVHSCQCISLCVSSGILSEIVSWISLEIVLVF